MLNGSIRLVVKYLGERTELCYYDGDEKIAAEVLESDRIVLNKGNPRRDGCGVLPGRHREAHVSYNNQKPKGDPSSITQRENCGRSSISRRKTGGLCAMYRKNGTLWCESPMPGETAWSSSRIMRTDR